ncbi:MAG: TlpA family protein disulfide reductase [Candidatus Dormibacteraeota bacterium]|uniref:TlpA family protein disulfide reductase n=1 Tax=Candidatus Dormiibacter inghamiae TaxID=3127013 RepID=A0A934K7N5_9BACT|nr:TlpA family protein disulfide reductase [Candidatus Dormibacteraeota bacterium]MBJ7607006.1 TlpA family protein disulfide reductase [Candidatus Dormibacteraeota bacterium]
MSTRLVLWTGVGALLLVVVAALGWGLLHARSDPGLLGQAAPEFSVERLDGGGQTSLQELRGQPVVLNFWASWCQPCREEMPLLGHEAVSRQATVHFLGVDTRDTAEAARAFLLAQPVPYPVGQARGGIPSGYQTDGLPTTYLLNSAGFVVAQHRGPLNAALLSRYLELVGIKS